MSQYPMYVVYQYRPIPNDTEYAYEASRHKSLDIARLKAQQLANRTHCFTCISQYWCCGVGKNMTMIDGLATEDLETFQPESGKRVITAWTMGYFPMTFGGNVYRPICCDVLATGPHDLGNNYFGYLITSPSGNTFVAEGETGALVGPTLSAVRKDIAEASPAVMRQQITEARIKSGKAERQPIEKFWQMLR